MLPEQRVRLWLIDVAWEYNNRHATRRDNPTKTPKFGIGANGNYSTGCIEETDLLDLCPMIRMLSARDAYMCLWATAPRLDMALKFMKYCGFHYTTVLFNWVKTTKHGKYFAGPGKYTLSNTEFVLLGRLNHKFSPMNPGSDLGVKLDPCWHSTAKGCYKPKQIVAVPHPRDERNKIIHSRKPIEVHEELEKWLFPYMREQDVACELFATEQRPGWACLGHALNGRLLGDELFEAVLAGQT